VSCPFVGNAIFTPVSNRITLAGNCGFTRRGLPLLSRKQLACYNTCRDWGYPIELILQNPKMLPEEEQLTDLVHASPDRHIRWRRQPKVQKMQIQPAFPVCGVFRRGVRFTREAGSRHPACRSAVQSRTFPRRRARPDSLTTRSGMASQKPFFQFPRTGFCSSIGSNRFRSK
jgi:hypothetical protein